MKTNKEYLALYQAQMEQGDVQLAYEFLLKYLMGFKTYFAEGFSSRYQVGKVSPGYMDFSYFPFFDDYLRERKLRFGIVLNHKRLRFELWLMGQNAGVQKEYWHLLKSSPWNEGRDEMPRYSVLEAVLVESPDFDDLSALSEAIFHQALSLTEEIMAYIAFRDESR